MTVKGKLGVGIIGLSAHGGWAALAHVPSIKALDGEMALVGASASSPASARAAAEKFGVPFCTADPAALAARPDVDLVVVTVKVPHHRELVGAALAAGKMVYCEWPLGNGLAEAEGMQAAAAAAGVRNFVGLQARSAPAVRYLRDLLAQGYVGDVLSTTLIGSGDFPWGGVSYSSMAYVTDVTTGATMLTIPFGHTLDSLCWLLGDLEHVAAVTAIRHQKVRLLDGDDIITATAPDQVALAGRLAGGAVLGAHYRGGTAPGLNFLWQIDGSKGSLQITASNGHLQYGFLTIRGGESGATELRDLPVPPNYQLVDTDPAGYHYAVAHAYRGVLDDLKHGTFQVPDFAAAVKTQAVLERIARGGP